MKKKTVCTPYTAIEDREINMQGCEINESFTYNK